MKREFEALKSTLPQPAPETPPNVNWEEPDAPAEEDGPEVLSPRI